MQTSLSILGALLLSILSSRRVLRDSKMKIQEWLCGAGYISQMSCASSNPSSTVLESFSIKFISTAFLLCKQTICFQLMILTIEHKMELNFLIYFFPFPPLFITSKCDLLYVECKICGPATAFIHL